MTGWKVLLRSDLMAQCDAYGRAVVASYESGGNEASRAYAMNGIEHNAALQAFAKAGECALCLLLDGRPESDIEWRVNGAGCRQPYDLRTFDGCTIDIKTVEPWKRRLIWPLSKNTIYDSKRFDVLALMVGDGPVFWWAGWIEKAEFTRRHHVAGPGSPLQAGTRYMDRNELHAPDAFARGGADARARP